MITSTKNYTKKKKTQKTDRQNPRTNGKSKAIQTDSQKEAYTYTPTKKRKRKKNIYISFGRSEVFCQHSVGVLYELFHM